MGSKDCFKIPKEGNITPHTDMECVTVFTTKATTDWFIQKGKDEESKRLLKKEQQDEIRELLREQHKDVIQQEIAFYDNFVATLKNYPHRYNDHIKSFLDEQLTNVKDSIDIRKKAAKERKFVFSQKPVPHRIITEHKITKMALKQFIDEYQGQDKLDIEYSRIGKINQRLWLKEPYVKWFKQEFGLGTMPYGYMLGHALAMYVENQK